MMLALCASFLGLSLILILSASSPLALGCSILLLTLTFCCLSSLLSFSWFSLLLFLIYVGGLLVMFAYFVALSPNQFHLFLMPPTVLQLTLCLILVFLLLNPPLPLTTFAVFSTGSTLPALFSPQNFLTLNFAALVLFITLLAVVKIVTLPLGPLRPFSS